MNDFCPDPGPPRGTVLHESESEAEIVQTDVGRIKALCGLDIDSVCRVHWSKVVMHTHTPTIEG